MPQLIREQRAGRCRVVVVQSVSAGRRGAVPGATGRREEADGLNYPLWLTSS